jgi:hypothetical protein
MVEALITSRATGTDSVSSADMAMAAEKKISAQFDALFGSEALRHDPIAYFKTVTDIQNPNLPNIMGELVEHYSPEAFSRICYAFAKGVEYVKEKYGTQPSMICLTEEKDPSAHANPETYGIFVPSTFLKQLLQRNWHRQSKTEPFCLSSEDMAMMFGVEEAFHVHQLSQDRDRVLELLKQQTVSHQEGGNSAYDQQPIEKEAMHVVHQAMKDLGVVERSTLSTRGVTPDVAAWVGEDYFKARTHPQSQASNNIAPFARVTTITTDGQVLHSPAPEMEVSPTISR